MYIALSSERDTLSESDLMEELERLAVVKSIADVQDVNYPAMVYVENPAKKPTTLRTPAHCSPTHRTPAHSSPIHRSPAHSSHHVHSQSIYEEKARDQVLATEVQHVKPTQQDLVAEDLAAQAEAQHVHPAQQEEDLVAQEEAKRVHPAYQVDDLAAYAVSAAGNILVYCRDLGG